MNLIFPIIIVLLVLCIITVRKIKKCIIVMRQRKDQIFQVSLTDRRNLSGDGDRQPEAFNRSSFESKHDVSLSVVSNHKIQKTAQEASKKRHDSYSKKQIQTNLSVSVNLLK